MKMYRMANTDLEVSVLAYGCMQLGRDWAPGGDRAKATRLIAAAREGGINFFDHADIYARGKSEAAFGEVLAATPGLRDTMVLQSKVGIRFKDDPQAGLPGRYDFSYEHILATVEGSLRRLQTDRLDILLLHRPDALVEPEEVARAFDELHASGKVRYFGVSNHAPAHMALLQKHLRQPLVANQLELNLLRSELITHGLQVNQLGPAFTAAEGTLDYCRQHDVRVQAWAPVANGQVLNPPPEAPAHAQAAAAQVASLAEAHNTTKEAIALAWLLRHPAGIQPIIGTTNADRIKASLPAADISLSREEWYGLLEAARGRGVA